MKIIADEYNYLHIELQKGWVSRYFEIRIPLLQFERNDKIPLYTKVLALLLPDFYKIIFNDLNQYSYVCLNQIVVNDFSKNDNLSMINDIFTDYLNQQMIILRLTDKER